MVMVILVVEMVMVMVKRVWASHCIPIESLEKIMLIDDDQGDVDDDVDDDYDDQDDYDDNDNGYDPTS